MPSRADGDGLGRQRVLRRAGALPDVPDAQRLLRPCERRMYRGTAEHMRQVPLPRAARDSQRFDLRAPAGTGIRRRRLNPGILMAEIYRTASGRAFYSYSSPKWART